MSAARVEGGGMAPRVGIWMAGDSLQGGGGAERRFGRMVAHLRGRADPPPVFLLMSSRLRRSFAEAGIELPEDYVICVDGDGGGGAGGGLLRRSLRESGKIRRLCREHRLDVIHFLAVSFHFIPFLLLKPRNVAVVYSLVAHGYVTRPERMSWKARWALRLYLARVDAIDPLYFGFERRYPEHAAKTRVTPCSFTDVRRFAPAPEREKWVVFCGRLEPAKNPILFLEAIDRLAPEMRRTGWRAFLLGGGVLRGEVEAFLRDRGLHDLVTVETVADTSERFRRSGIYVSLQDLENYPSQSLLEAMAAGNAVVATDVGDTRRLVGPETGLLVSGRDGEELASALSRLMGDPERRAAMGVRARAFVVENHTVERASAHLLDVWKLAVDRKRGRV